MRGGLKRVNKGFDILKIGRHGVITFISMVQIATKLFIFGIYVIKEKLFNFE